MLTRNQISELRNRETSPNRVKAAMELADVTQVQVAAAIGVTQSYISVIANGNYSGLPLDTAQRLAEYFGCSTDDLFPAREDVA